MICINMFISAQIIKYYEMLTMPDANMYGSMAGGRANGIHGTEQKPFPL